MAATSLLSRRRLIHRLIAVIVATAAACIAALGVHYSGDYRAGWVDHAIDARIRHRLRDQLEVLHHVVTLADPASIVTICAALAAIFFFTGRRRAAVFAVLGPLVAVGVTDLLLKPAIGRRMGDGLAFPSGHTTAAVSVALVIVVVLLGPSRPRWPAPARWAACVVAVGCAGMVAVALVGSGYHYATDTLGGFCVAVMVVPTVAWLIDRLADRIEAGMPPDRRSQREFTRSH